MATNSHHHVCFWLKALLLVAIATAVARADLAPSSPAPLALPPEAPAVSTTPCPPPFQPKPSATDQFLSVHNQARDAVKVAALRWNQKLSNAAARVVRIQKTTKRCQFADLRSAPYGSNQAWTSYAVSPAEAVQTWVSTGKYYNYGNNTCTAGHKCRTYTQVVWRQTTDIGCAQTSCPKDTLTVCLYFPRGNIRGQKPY